MKKQLLTLTPFENFKCIGKACKHNCCIGWQIDVDKKTLKKYRKVRGGFSEKLNSGVDYKNRCFKMNDKTGEKRCAFLNDENLCEIIINLGENYLCEICREHPRFYNDFKKVKEWGVGLACETAAKSLITAKNPSFSHPVNLKNYSSFDREIITFRESLFNLLSVEKPLNDRITDILGKIGVKNGLTEYDYSALFLTFESIDESFNGSLIGLKPSLVFPKTAEKYFTNLLIYFLFRHIPLAFDKLDLKSRALFSVFSVATVNSLCKGDYGEQNVINAAREYSAEIEYSELNLNAVLDVLDEIVVKGN